MNLRPLKPYDLTGPEVTFFRTPVDVQGLAGPDVAIAIGDDDPAIDAKAGVVLTVAVPKAIAPISSVSVASVGGGVVPILERLRDMGIESDVAQVTLPNRGAPVVGDLWLLVPRDRIWSPGHYELRVEATGDSFVRRFRLT